SVRMSASVVDALRRTAVPVVVIGNVPDDFPIDSVRTSSKRAAHLAVKHLVDSGRRAIGFINGSQDTAPGRGRREGYEEALAAEGLPFKESFVALGNDFTHQAGHK